VTLTFDGNEMKADFETRTRDTLREGDFRVACNANVTKNTCALSARVVWPNRRAWSG